MFNFLRNAFGGGDRNAANNSRQEPQNVSQPINQQTTSSGVPSAPVSYEMVSVQLPLPEDLVILILSHVSYEDLSNYCVYVEEWKPIINSQSLWKLKCHREGKVIPKARPKTIPPNFYRSLYFARFNENILKNPCGAEDLKHWKEVIGGSVGYYQAYYDQHELRGWEVQNPPQGSDPVPGTACQHCFATTYFWCRKSQQIDLYKEGFTAELIEALKPKIYVGEWYAARFDCGSEYDLDVRLLDEKEDVLARHHFHHMETQWTGKAWSFTEHEFTDYPPSVRYILFIHAGKDTQFWAGNYGSKMAEGRVILRLE